MLVYKDGGEKDILGFTCDLCNEVTITDVIPNQHGEFRYTCPKCGHHMRELMEDKKEETTMVNTYTVSNAAKRLNCSISTITRAVRDGRFHDCFQDTSCHGKPAWMIPSDQVEEWVTKGGFNKQGKKLKKASIVRQPCNYINPKDLNLAEENKKAIEAAQNKLNEKLESSGIVTSADIEDSLGVRKVFDPEVGKEVPVLNFLDNAEPSKLVDEFAKRAVKRVAKPKWTKVLDRTKEDKVMKDIPEKNEQEKRVMNSFAKLSEPTFHPAALKVDGFSITIPKEVVEGIVQEQVRKDLSEKLARIRKAMDSLNEELKTLEEAIA